jgi:energy-coupling factor transporter ATP-binding protein EcfA2
MINDFKNNYYIKRIRLINFHNFVNETIELTERGHLFVLGDNGSGKTTLIDAVHYVLSAGESMEFNSAARIAGNKTGGRRAQGLITRYNIDVGHLNPNGAITYAALEIIGHNGNPWTVAIGMSVNSPDENLKRWGIIRSGNLKSVPFLIENENDEFRPKTAFEMKKALNNTGFFGQLQRYKNILAQQFLGGEKQFKDFCMFLSLGKAYREIASQTTDYHELFKKLLPEPRRDLFEKIIDSLKSLDSSRNEIQSLRDKYEYIKNLLSLVDNIKYKQKHAFAGDCIALQFEVEDIKNSLKVLTHKKKRLAEKYNQFEKDFSVKEKEKKYIENQLEDYRQKDANGLIREEKTINERQLNLSNEKINTQNILEKQNEKLSKLKQLNNSNTDNIREQFKSFFAKFTKLSLSMPFSISDLIAAFEKLIHIGIKEGIDEIKQLQFDDYYNKAGHFRDSIVIEISKQEKMLEDYNEHISRTEIEIKQLEEQLEFLPDVEYFGEVIEEFKELMIDGKPLYKGLVWGKGIKQNEMNATEELIGPDILCSFIVPEEAYKKASDIVFNDYPGIRLIPLKKLDSDKQEIPLWIKKYFNISESDPYSIIALATEMFAKEEVVFNISKNLSKAKFRAHEKSFSGLESYIIGEENRNQKIKRDLENLKLDLRDYKKAVDELKIGIKEKEKIKRSLIAFLDILNKDTRRLDKNISMYNEYFSEIKNINAVVDDKQIILDNIVKEGEQLDIRLDNIKEIIEKEGLANLENIIKELTQKLNMLEKELRSIDKKIGSNEAQTLETEKEYDSKYELIEQTEKKYSLIIDKFKALYELAGDINSYFNEQRNVYNLHNAVDCRNMASKARIDEVKSKAVLTDRIRDKRFSIEFGFNYDEENNLLIDRANRNIKDICSKYDIEIREQQEIINERTTELFKKIIMDELVFYLRERIEHLQTMVKKINHLLNDRYFGNNLYVFKIKVQKKYERLLEIIKKYNPLNEEIENELQNFFKDYRSEIVDTDPSEIPEILDYRNWYHYEMYVKTPDSEGNAMDKRIKSIGSGGEQAVPNYLLILTISHFLYSGTKIKLPVLIFDEAFYGIDAGRRDQLMGFAGDIGLQIFIATPDQDGVRKEIAYSTSLLVRKDKNYDVHIYPFHWKNPENDNQGKLELFEEDKEEEPVRFGEEL